MFSFFHIHSCHFIFPMCRVCLVSNNINIEFRTARFARGHYLNDHSQVHCWDINYCNYLLLCQIEWWLALIMALRVGIVKKIKHISCSPLSSKLISNFSVASCSSTTFRFSVTMQHDCAVAPAPLNRRAGALEMQHNT